MPIEGHKRCLKHAGPHAARRFRETQIEALGRGELSWDAFQAHEWRRAANKLQRLWKTSPWIPGETIDLGGHEDRFVADLRLGGFGVDMLAPAVVDKVRWRWRRFRLDRDDLGGWRAFLTTELPDRIRKAGPRPVDVPGDAETAVAALFRVEEKLPPGSKRRRPSTPRAPKKAPTRPKRSSAPDIDDEALARVLVEHGGMIRRLVGDDADARTTRRLAALLHQLLTLPDDPGAGEQWRRAVAECAAKR